MIVFSLVLSEGYALLFNTGYENVFYFLATLIGFTIFIKIVAKSTDMVCPHCKKSNMLDTRNTGPHVCYFCKKEME